MEYDNEENTWRRPSVPKAGRARCEPIPRRSTTVAVVVLGLAVLSCLLGYCVLSETLPYETRTLRLVIIVSCTTFNVIHLDELRKNSRKFFVEKN